MEPEQNPPGQAAEPGALSSWRSPFGPLFSLPAIGMALVTVFAPADVLDACRTCESAAALGRNALLSLSPLLDIRRFADSTAYPQVALLVCAVHWLLLPVMCLLNVALMEIGIRWTHWRKWKAQRNGDPKVRAKEVLQPLLGLALFIGCAAAATMIEDDLSRAGMAFFVGTIFFVIPICVGALYGLMRAWWVFNIRGGR